MDLSLKAYIERQPSEKLEDFLEQYYEGTLEADYTYVVPYVEYVLDRRKRTGQS